ncbi:hypothetical protein TNCV_1093841 [Trichonephila clavipes]|uniref:Uncharacterized protein n=1 Tax=Trichonephila clavipes TaxID=2585209 RepID=A0A8X6RJI0_TRICX|nr:hypothetical protein TNCV_1093841 [Trichonephila clavipes]
MVDKDILEIVQSSKSVIAADSNDKNEINNAAHISVSSEMRNSIKMLHLSHSHALNLHYSPESGDNLFMALRFSAGSAFSSAIFRPREALLSPSAGPEGIKREHPGIHTPLSLPSISREDFRSAEYLECPLLHRHYILGSVSLFHTTCPGPYPRDDQG